MQPSAMPSSQEWSPVVNEELLEVAEVSPASPSSWRRLTPRIVAGALAIALLVVLHRSFAPEGAAEAVVPDGSVVDGVVSEAQTACSAVGEGCAKSMCCKNKDMMCYQKNADWADCKKSCDKGQVDTNSEKKFQSPWTCKKLSPYQCAGRNQNCIKSQCCLEPGHKCYKKNPYYAGCRKTCAANQMYYKDPIGHRYPWSCALWDDNLSADELAAHVPPHSKFCSAAGEGCATSMCCKNSSMTCYQKNADWADCKMSCNKGQVDTNSEKKFQSPWTCKKLLSPYKCAGRNENCITSQCCLEPGHKCYKKNSHFAGCRTTCAAKQKYDQDPIGHRYPWSCVPWDEGAAWDNGSSTEA